MEATVNKQAAIDGYAAFGARDAEGAMKDIAESVEWVVPGNNSLTGTYHGKEEVGGLWMKLLEKDFNVTPKEFVAEGDKVVVICDNSIAGEQVESVNVLSYDRDGKLVRFQAYGGEELFDRTFPR